MYKIISGTEFNITPINLPYDIGKEYKIENIFKNLKEDVDNATDKFNYELVERKKDITSLLMLAKETDFVNKDDLAKYLTYINRALKGEKLTHLELNTIIQFEVNTLSKITNIVHHRMLVNKILFPIESIRDIVISEKLITPSRELYTKMYLSTKELYHKKVTDKTLYITSYETIKKYLISLGVDKNKIKLTNKIKISTGYNAKEIIFLDVPWNFDNVLRDVAMAFTNNKIKIYYPLSMNATGTIVDKTTDIYSLFKNELQMYLNCSEGVKTILDNIIGDTDSPIELAQNNCSIHKYTE